MEMSKLNPSRYLQVHLASFRLANTDVLDKSALYGAASTGDHEGRLYGQDDRRRIITS